MEQDRRNPEEEAGGYGTPTAEQEMGAGTQFAQPRTAQPRTAQDSAEPEVLLPSAEAPMDEGNTEVPGRPDVDSSSGPDGGATSLPAEKSPRDDEDEDERFDAG